MNKQNVTKFLKTIQVAVSKHSPEILTGIGIAGMITTTVLAVKATPKALQLIDDAEYEKSEGESQSLRPIEVIKVAWKPYIPAVIMGVSSVACLIGANSVHHRRNAALATAYQLASTTLTEYKDQVVETIGEKKEKAIREKVAQKKLDENPIDNKTIIVTGGGDCLFVEPISMRPFTSDIQRVREVINDLNERMVVGMEEYISLSEFYDEIGLKRTENSDDIGWNLGKDGSIKCDFHPCVTEDGKPALMLEYRVGPRYGFMDLM